MQKRLILILIFLLSVCQAQEKEADYYKELSDNIKLFFDVMYTLNENYVDTADIENLMKEGISAMLATTDPYTILLKEDQVSHYTELSSGKYGGIGIYLGTSGQDKRLTVISPIDGTPASKVGLRAGDRIIYIDKRDTKGMTVREASKFLRGEAGTKVILKVKRNGGEKLLEFELTRDDIDIKNVPYAGLINGNTGYIKLSQFTATSYYDIRLELERLISDGAKSVILDLRYNPGGLLTAAVKISNIFLPEDKVVVSTKGRGSNIDNMIKTYLTPVDTEMPVAVLINGSSASASEITAGAFQDHDRGVVIGETSFGKGLVQQIYDIGRMRTEKLKVTVRKYYTPSGRLIQKDDIFGDIARNGKDTVFYETLKNKRKVPSGIGIVPDIIVEDPEVSEYIANLKMKNHFSDFVYDLYKNEPDLEYKDQVSSAILERFRDYIKERKFDYTTESEKLIDSLVTKLKNDEKEESLIAKIKDIKTSILELKRDDFKSNIEMIKKYLDIEFTVYNKGNGEKYRILNRTDPAVLRAVEILNDQSEYEKILGY